LQCGAYPRRLLGQSPECHEAGNGGAGAPEGVEQAALERVVSRRGGPPARIGAESHRGAGRARQRRPQPREALEAVGLSVLREQDGDVRRLGHDGAARRDVAAGHGVAARAAVAVAEADGRRR